MSSPHSPAAAALAAGGVFDQALANFTPRAAQQEMAAMVEDALAHHGVLVVESGTGTGKTFAYLAPIVLSGRRTIISTGTKHLQEQIFHRDLPQVARALKMPVDAVLLKGRSNYLCLHRLKAQLQQVELIADDDATTLQSIEQWAATTSRGDIAEFTALGESSALWREVTTTAENCLGGACPEYRECFVVKARQRAMRADVVVVNHHLFFSDLTLKADGFGELLPEYEAVVFDEAHGLAEIASAFFGFSLASGQAMDLVRDALAAEDAERSGVDCKAAAAAVEKALQGMHRATRAHHNQSVDFAALQGAKFDRACGALVVALAQLEAALQAAAPAGETLQRCHQRCLALQARLDDWLHDSDSAFIRWAEIGARRFRLHATPIAINDSFAQVMQARRSAWIFTSATLAVGDDFTAFCNSLGLAQSDTGRWDSPYNFADNALLYLPPRMPPPNDPNYADALCETIAQLLAASRGRAFCLFTTHEMMQRAHAKLRDDAKWPVLLQGDAPKRELLQRFSADARSVLFGTASFWEGVDVVGESLSCVIIDKLPFAPPGDPVLKSRLRACEESGGNAFMDMQIPSAVIALKQGAGRLIRSESDRGVLALCDARILSKPYGKLFLRCLPKMPRTQDVSEVAAFFARER